MKKSQQFAAKLPFFLIKNAQYLKFWRANQGCHESFVSSLVRSFLK
jgi:hypothetical protein